MRKWFVGMCLLLSLTLMHTNASAVLPNLSEVVIDYATSGDHTLIAGTAGKRIRVYRLFFFCNAATNVTISDSTPTVIIPVMNILQSQGVSFGMSEIPYIVTGVGKDIVFNMSAAQQCSGRVWYNVN